MSECQKRDSLQDNPDLNTAVERVLASRTFARSEQLKRLLQHLRDASNSGDPNALSELAIGLTVLHRKDFDPKTDTIVRSEMVRLRRKLDEFYATECQSEKFRVTLDRYTYRLSLTELHSAPAVMRDPAKEAFRRGLAMGVGAMLVVGIVVTLLFFVFNGENRIPAAVSQHPLWKDLAGGPVTVVVGTPLFFRNGRGFERNWHLNLPTDLVHSKDLLANWPATPVWDKWAAFEDLPASVALDRFLRSIKASGTFLAAHDASAGNLAKGRTVILAHPRFAPVLVELLADQNFRASPPPDPVTAGYTGFHNVDPRAGEPAEYRPAPRPRNRDARDSFLENIDESDPDYALISSIHLRGGGVVLSIFGDRTPTTGFVLRSLTSSDFLNELNRRVFTNAPQHFESVQIVLRVDYNRGKPTGVVYTTHRVKQRQT